MFKQKIILTFIMALFIAANVVSTGSAVERSEIPDKYKWKPEHIYASEEDWEKDFTFVESGVEKLAAFKGAFAGDKADNPAASMMEFNKLAEDIGSKFEKLYTYVMYNYHVDLSNSKWIGMIQRCQSLGVRYGENLAWVDPEILEIPEATLMKWVDENPGLEDYRKSYQDLYAQQAHVLSEPEEKILALSGNITGTSGDVFGKLTDADMKFGFILDEKGDSVEVTDAGWVSWRKNKNRRVRENYWRAVWNTYDSFGTSISALMSGNLKKDVYLTKARKYETTLHRALDSRFIPVEVYINLVETTRKNTAPLHKYNEIRKRALGLPHYRHWDYYVSMVDFEEEDRYTWEQAVEMVTESLKPMGKKYVADITYALNPENGWVDPYAHKTKRGGAYSSRSYGIHGYMLYNFDFEKGLTFNDVSTIAHEVGHSMHSHYSEKDQAYPNKNYAIFNAEVASTTNEAIMTMKYLEKAREEFKKVKKYKDHKDPKKSDAFDKAKNKLMYLLESNIDAVRQTFYRQTMFATWEWEAHKMAEKDVPLTKDSMNKLYYDLLQEFHGPAAEYPELSAISWSRIPHFYRGYYVYSYATSYAASMALAKNIVAEAKGDKSKKGAQEKFLAFLASGSSRHPVELLQDAGVDMATPAPVQSLIDQFAQWVDELDEITQM